MSDLVERLRDKDAVVVSGLFHAIPAMHAAADEIERLRKDCNNLRAKVAGLRSEIAQMKLHSRSPVKAGG